MTSVSKSKPWAGGLCAGSVERVARADCPLESLSFSGTERNGTCCAGLLHPRPQPCSQGLSVPAVGRTWQVPLCSVGHQRNRNISLNGKGLCAEGRKTLAPSSSTCRPSAHLTPSCEAGAACSVQLEATGQAWLANLFFWIFWTPCNTAPSSLGSVKEDLGKIRARFLMEGNLGECPWVHIQPFKSCLVMSRLLDSGRHLCNRCGSVYSYTDLYQQWIYGFPVGDFACSSSLLSVAVVRTMS